MTRGFHKWRWRGIAVWLVFFTLIVGWSTNETYHVSHTTHTALCSFTDDLTDRRDSNIRFLADHPAGLVINGRVVVSAATLQQTIDNQTKAIDSLQGLNC